MHHEPSVGAHPRRALHTCLTIALALGLTLSAHAQTAPAAVTAPPSAPKGSTAKEPRNERQAALMSASQALDGADALAIEQALTALVQLGGKEAAELVGARLRRGLPPQLLEAAVNALVQLKQPGAAVVLVELTTHRRWQVRELAIGALAALKARTAQSALLYALDDPNAPVREAAARALGQVGDVRALPALVTAQERGVASATVALASLGGPRELEPLQKRVQAGECVALIPALEALLARANLPVQQKLKVVELLPAAKDGASCAEALLGALGPKPDPRLSAALGAARTPKPLAAVAEVSP